jgi:hypothetical protein
MYPIFHQEYISLNISLNFISSLSCKSEAIGISTLLLLLKKIFYVQICYPLGYLTFDWIRIFSNSELSSAYDMDVIILLLI